MNTVLIVTVIAVILLLARVRSLEAERERIAREESYRRQTEGDRKMVEAWVRWLGH